jgi:hypothetical protein
VADGPTSVEVKTYEKATLQQIQTLRIRLEQGNWKADSDGEDFGSPEAGSSHLQSL